MWCDQAAKSVWSWLDSNFFNLSECTHHFKSFILQQTPLKLDIWFQRYGQLKGCKNNKKQKILCLLFGYNFVYILKSIFLTFDWFCLITSHIIQHIYWDYCMLNIYIMEINIPKKSDLKFLNVQDLLPSRAYIQKIAFLLRFLLCIHFIYW